MAKIMPVSQVSGTAVSSSVIASDMEGISDCCIPTRSSYTSSLMLSKIHQNSIIYIYMYISWRVSMRILATCGLWHCLASEPSRQVLRGCFMGVRGVAPAAA